MSTMLLDHIAIAVRRLADAPDVLVGALGGEPAYGAPGRGYTFGQWRYAGGGRLELIEPAGPPGFLHRFLAQRGPGIHHVTFKVADILEARGRAQADGYDIVGFDDSDPSWKTFFLHPRQALGLVVQLAQASGPDPRQWTPPPGPATPPPPVRLLGLRVRVRSRDRAQALWERFLLGTPTGTGDREVSYRWPGSPMRILVELDSGADEGPVAVEYAADRDVPLPETPLPGLGARFVRRPAPGA